MKKWNEIVNESNIKATVRIKRPNGNIEVVDVPENLLKGSTENGFRDKIFPMIVKSTKQAGKGDVLDYEYDKNETISQHENRCERCGDKINGKVFYRSGSMKMGSQMIKTNAPYCLKCNQLLNAMTE